MKRSYIIILMALLGFNITMQTMNAVQSSDTAVVFDIDDVLIKRCPSSRQNLRAFASIVYNADRPFKLVFSSLRLLLTPKGRVEIRTISESQGTYAIVDEIIRRNPALQQSTLYKGVRQPIGNAIKDVIATGTKIPGMFDLVEELKKKYYVTYATNQGKEVTDHNIALGILPAVEDSLHPFRDQSAWIKKPNSRYYQELAQKLSSYKTIIVIDDKAVNIESAQKTDSRITGITYTTSAQVKAELRKLDIL